MFSSAKLARHDGSTDLPKSNATLDRSLKLLLVFTATAILFLPIYYPDHSLFQLREFYILAGVSVSFGAAYLLNHRSLTDEATLLTVAALSTALFIIAWPQGSKPVNESILYLIVPIGLAFVLLPLRAAMSVALINLAALAFFIFALPLEARLPFLTGQYIFILTLTAMIFLVTYYQQQAEKLRQAHLLEREAYYHELFEYSPVPLWEQDHRPVRRYTDALRQRGIADLDAYFRDNPASLREAVGLIKINNVNQATMRLLRMQSKDELAGRSPHVTDTMLDLFREEVIAIANGRRTFQGQGFGYTAVGDPIDVEVHWSISPEVDDLSRVLVSTLDISERKRAEAERLALARQQERMQVVDNFVQAISHDFRNALATIQTSRYMIERLFNSEQASRIPDKLTSIDQQVKHMAEQIENLQAIAALSNLRLTPCSINDLVASVVAGYSAKAAQKSLHLHFEPASDLPAIPTAQGELSRAIGHLLANAITHTPENGSVMLKTGLREDEVFIQVSDTGSGIDREHLSHVFDMFYRSNPARPLSEGGIGLGLSIAKMIVEAHNGHMTLESEAGAGSIFTIWLPAAKPQPV
jgi:signal transduction histidine kinase